MKWKKIITTALAVPVFASCGLIDDLQSQISSAIGDLTSLTDGNIGSLVEDSGGTIEAASAQLETLKTSAKTDSSTASSFRLGKTSQGRLLAANFTPMAEDSADGCPKITRENDKETKTRKATSDFSGCAAANGQKGTIISTLVDGDGSTDLSVEFQGYVTGDKKKSGTVSWSLNFLSNEDVLITSTEQLSIIGGTADLFADLDVLGTAEGLVKRSRKHAAYPDAIAANCGAWVGVYCHDLGIETADDCYTYLSDSVLGVSDGNAVPINSEMCPIVFPEPDKAAVPPETPVSVISANQTINYKVTKDGVLTIDGTGSVEQGADTATLSFAGVKWLLGLEGCASSPTEGTITMSKDGENAKVVYTACGTGTSTSADGTTGDPDAALTASLLKTLDALNGFYRRVKDVGEKQNQINECLESDTIDTFETTDGNADRDADTTGNRTDNNTQAKAAVLADKLKKEGDKLGDTWENLSFGDDDWYKISIPGDATTPKVYAIEAIPKNPDSLWPLVCVKDKDGKIISELPDFLAGPPVPGPAPAQADAPAVECFPGFALLELDKAGLTEIFIQITDDFGEYACQSYTLAVYDINSGFVPPAIDFGGGGGDCPVDFIADDICDIGCHTLWLNDGENIDADKAICDQFDAGEGGGAGGACPLFWINDPICDTPCHSTWTAAGHSIAPDEAACTAEESFVPTAGECPVEWIGDTICDQGCVDANVWTAAQDSTGDDGGDCAGGGGGVGLPCGGVASGNALCSIIGASLESSCVSQTPGTGCGDLDCQPGEIAVYTALFNDITCEPI